MKLGDVLKKEREKIGLDVAKMSSELKLKESEYTKLEAGASDAERWGPLLAQIAITLEVPTSRLLAESGRAEDTKAGHAGKLIKGHREKRGKTVSEVAKAIGVDVKEYEIIEKGDSPIERVGPQLLRFAEVIGQPVFNLFYPCGIPFAELDDYP